MNVQKGFLVTDKNVLMLMNVLTDQPIARRTLPVPIMTVATNVTVIMVTRNPLMVTTSVKTSMNALLIQLKRFAAMLMLSVPILSALMTVPV